MWHLKSYIYNQPPTCFLWDWLLMKQVSWQNISCNLELYNLCKLYRQKFCLFTVSKYNSPLTVYCHLFQDEHVIKLTQELAQKLGFKIRKAYVRAEVSWHSLHQVFPFYFVIWRQFCFFSLHLCFLSAVIKISSCGWGHQGKVITSVRIII